jgi:hypothetical protein
VKKYRKKKEILHDVISGFMLLSQKVKDHIRETNKKAQNNGAEREYKTL